MQMAKNRGLSQNRPKSDRFRLQMAKLGSYQIHSEARGPHWIAWVSRDGAANPTGRSCWSPKPREGRSQRPPLGGTVLILVPDRHRGSRRSRANAVSRVHRAAAGRRNVPHLHAARHERVGDQLAVALPPHRLGTHHRRRAATAHAIRSSSGRRSRRLHVVGVATEARRGATRCWANRGAAFADRRARRSGGS